MRSLVVFIIAIFFVFSLQGVHAQKKALQKSQATEESATMLSGQSESKTYVRPLIKTLSAEVLALAAEKAAREAQQENTFSFAENMPQPEVYRNQIVEINLSRPHIASAEQSETTEDTAPIQDLPEQIFIHPASIEPAAGGSYEKTEPVMGGE